MSERLGDRIGKYRILARIGRGGMGTVLKAHDPILDRTVALKVVSPDVDLTDEMRARFFREAQACARLSHPNVITVYDLADTDGQLFIIMEFLEGEELKQVIAQRRPLSLEDKLAIMVQVCDGLAYAHERGVVHRDIKPGNIFVLATGRVKILDFGIARIVSSEVNLTRTGLIMGTLRYMAPEQARGRADYRADIFSVGAVFYELLAYRPAFEADDPMEILEALRTHEPPLLSDVDPEIPVDVARMIAAALRKDPTARLQDLVEMRRVFEATRRRLFDEAEELRARLRPQLERLRAVHAVVAGRLGAPLEDDTAPMAAERAGVIALRQLEQHAAARISKLGDLLRRAEGVEPVLARALELQKAGDAGAVVEALEPVVRDIPEHVRASAVLTAAREQLERERRQHEAFRRVLGEARAALDQGRLTACLQELAGLQNRALPADLRVELERLRRDAEAARAAEARRREELRRAREHAERLRDELVLARRRARDAQAAQTAPAVWNAAEARAGQGHTALQADAPPAAIADFEAALELYRSAEAEAHAAARARIQAQAESARARAREARRLAEAVDAAALAAALWQRACAHDERAAAALVAEDFTAAVTAFEEARQLYESADTAAREDRKRRAREQVEREREDVARRRSQAIAAEASVHASARWTEAEACRALAEQATTSESYASASQHYADALRAYEQAVSDAGITVLARQRAAADEARQRAGAARRDAEDARASVHAADAWSVAEAAEREASAASERSDLTASATLFAGAERAFRNAAAAARSERLRQERDAADRARSTMDAARTRAQASGGVEHAHPTWLGAEARRRDGSAAFVRGGFLDATAHFEAATGLYQEAETSGREVRVASERAAAEAAAREREAESRRVEALAVEARELLAAGDVDEALARAREALDVIRTHPAAAEIEARAAAESRRRHAKRAAIDRLYAEAQARVASRDFESAITSLEQLLQIDPVHLGAIQALDTARAALERERADRERRAAAVEAEATPLERAVPRRLHEGTEVMGVEVDDDATALAMPIPGQPDRRGQETPVVAAEPPRRPRLTATRRQIAAAVSVALLGAALGYLAIAPRSRPPARVETPSPATGRAERTTPETPPTRAVEPDKRAVLAARQIAETAGATAFAAATFASAVQLEQQGDDAVATTRFDEARRLYDRAVAAYDAAAAEARTRSAAAARQEGTRQVQTQAAAAKRGAEIAGARDAARGAWMQAEKVEQQALALLRDDNHDAARQSFREAEQLFRQAERAAADALAAQRSAEERQRAESLRAALRSAEDARTRAAKARESAQSAGAERYAGPAFTSAGEHDREGQANLAGRDYAKAEARFREAERGFVAALEEANRARESERQQVAVRQRELEAAAARLQAVAQARQAASDQRQVAHKAGADILAKELFDDGASRFRSGEELAQSRKWTDATDAFREAGTRFTAAERRVREIAEVRTHADAARERREQAIHAGADRLAKEVFDAAAARHTEADRVARSARILAAIPIYNEAAEGYRAAERRAATFGRAREEVLGVLADYTRAFETKDPDLLRRLRPGLSARELNAYRDSWAEVSSFRIVLKPERVDIRGDEAEVSGRREDIVIRKDGRRERGEGERPFRFKLRRGKEGWTIDSVS